MIVLNNNLGLLIVMPSKPPATILHEPLLQFLFLGTLIFAFDYYLIGSADDPRRIIVDDKQLNELITIFEQGQGRKPSPNETENLLVKWTQNEILYREALQLGLDQGDEMIRNRVILKMRNVLFNNVSLELPPEPELRSWFAEHRKLYDRPAYFDFEQLTLAGIDNEADAAAVSATLHGDEIPEKYQSSLRKFRHRPANNISSLYGERANALLTQPRNTWVTVQDAKGWHLARITAEKPARAATFDNVRTKVAKDWRRYSNDLQLVQQTTEIADRYTIVMQLSPELKQDVLPDNESQVNAAGSKSKGAGITLANTGDEQ